MTVALAIAPEEPIREIVSYDTDIIRGRDGSEHRTSHRPYPRRQFDMSVILETDTEIQEWRAHLFNRGVPDLHMPIWHEGMRSTAAAISGTATINVDLTYSDLAATMLVMIMQPDGSSYDIRTIDSVTASSITVTVNFSQTFPLGSVIYPVELAKLTDGPAIERWPIDAGILKLIASITAHRELTGNGATVTTYESLPVLDRRLVSPGLTEEKFTWQIRRQDAGGVFIQDSDRTYARIDKARRGFIETPAERQWWRAFITGQLGALNLCLVPTWRDDLNLAVQPSSGSSTIDVEDEPDWIADYESSLAHSWIQLETDAGIIYRTIDSAAYIPNSRIRLTLTAALPAGDGSVINRISFLELSRLGDVFTYTHQQAQSFVDFHVFTVQDTVITPPT